MNQKVPKFLRTDLGTGCAPCSTRLPSLYGVCLADEVPSMPMSKKQTEDLMEQVWKERQMYLLSGVLDALY